MQKTNKNTAIKNKININKLLLLLLLLLFLLTPAKSKGLLSLCVFDSRLCEVILCCTTDFFCLLQGLCHINNNS